MATIETIDTEKRHIKDAYRYPGFTPLARLERVSDIPSHHESWAVTLRRRGKKDGVRELRDYVQELVRPAHEVYQGFRLRTIRHLSTCRSTQGILSHV